MKEIVTSDWNRFGNIEIEEARILLKHIGDIDSYGKPEIMFNTESGCVFITDEDYNVWMMNGEEIERFYSCPICGHEGFAEDMIHADDKYSEECKEWLSMYPEITKPEE